MLWRRHFDHKPAILRAYHAADEDGTGFVERDEFTKLLQYIVFFNNLWCVPLFQVAGSFRLIGAEGLFVGAGSGSKRWMPTTTAT